MITANDDWSGVPGIVGFRGDDLVTATGVDPRTILVDGSTTPIDVIANQTNPDTNTAGGVAEFEIANPVVALQGSGTADAPHLVIYLNTTGQSNINFTANIRDIDASADDAIQQVDVQYRVGGTGNYTSVPGGYIADATTGGSATQVTALSLTLPADANNRPLVEIRIITTNALGSDEWVGVDDISVTAGGGGGTPTPTTPTPTTPTPTTPTPTTPTPTTPTPTTGDANVDMNGDGRSDYVITRILGGLKTWWVSISGTNATSDGQFGLANDIETPEDFDGDGRDDLAVWRFGGQGSGIESVFYIYQSSSNTVRTENFGRLGDVPIVVGDYDGDNKADPAVYRPAAPGQQSYFFYRGSLNNPNRITTFVPWGRGDMRPYNGDFDGDGKNDFCLFTTVNGRGQFLLLKSNGFGVEYIDWGLPTDTPVPGDFDGDKRSDFCVVRPQNGQHAWFILERDGGGTGASPILWGLTTDNLAPGDYDGDAKQDIAVWRSSADPSMNFFLVRRSSDSALQFFEWGQQGDSPAADWYVESLPIATP
ncbi:MAG TPA: VCBS repeat-containing protein [Pyrinomonadaceae bacterium]